VRVPAIAIAQNLAEWNSSRCHSAEDARANSAEIDAHWLRSYVEIAKNRSPNSGRLVNGPSSSTQARNKETCEPPGELYCVDAAQMSDVESDELLTWIKFETAAMW
jgi:hypothetical protein